MPAERGPSGTGHDTAACGSCAACLNGVSSECAAPPVAVPGPASEPERYTISEDRLAEIRALIAHDRYGYRVLPASAQVTALELAAAVDDLLDERDERTDA